MFVFSSLLYISNANNLTPNWKLCCNFYVILVWPILLQSVFNLIGDNMRRKKKQKQFYNIMCYCLGKSSGKSTTWSRIVVVFFCGLNTAFYVRSFVAWYTYVHLTYRINGMKVKMMVHWISDLSIDSIPCYHFISKAMHKRKCKWKMLPSDEKSCTSGQVDALFKFECVQNAGEIPTQTSAIGEIKLSAFACLLLFMLCLLCLFFFILLCWICFQ